MTEAEEVSVNGAKHHGYVRLEIVNGLAAVVSDEFAKQVGGIVFEASCVGCERFQDNCSGAGEVKRNGSVRMLGSGEVLISEEGCRIPGSGFNIPREYLAKSG